MADTERLARLAELTAESHSKLVLAGDAAQLGSIGAGGLFEQLRGSGPDRRADRGPPRQPRVGAPGLGAGPKRRTRTRARRSTRPTIASTSTTPARRPRRRWSPTGIRPGRSLPGGRAVMITDASNKERDQINAMAQERRAAAGELGSHRVELPGKPYGLRAGDEVIFSAQFQIPGADRRVENGITGTVVDTDRDEDRVTIETHEREPREVAVDTEQFSDLSLAYAVHVYKAQGITAETSRHPHRRLADRPRARLRRAQPRPRADPDLRLARGPRRAGMDIGAIERLAEKMKRSRAQASHHHQGHRRAHPGAPADQATRAPPPNANPPAQGHERRDSGERDHSTPRELRQPRHWEIDDFLDPRRTRATRPVYDDDFIARDEPDHDQQDRVEADARDRFTNHDHAQRTRIGTAPINIQHAEPGGHRSADVRDHGDIRARLLDPALRRGKPSSHRRAHLCSCSADGRPISSSGSSPPSQPRRHRRADDHGGPQGRDIQH